MKKVYETLEKIKEINKCRVAMYDDVEFWIWRMSWNHSRQCSVRWISFTPRNLHSKHDLRYLHEEHLLYKKRFPESRNKTENASTVELCTHKSRILEHNPPTSNCIKTMLKLSDLPFLLTGSCGDISRLHWWQKYRMLPVSTVASAMFASLSSPSLSTSLLLSISRKMTSPEGPWVWENGYNFM